MNQIFEIDCERKTPKYIQIINSVTKSIKQGKLKKGDRILSINELSAAFYLSRDTVQKAYDMLEDRGIILPVRGKGFYINRTDVSGSYRVLLLFNKISNYKKLVYNSFVDTLGKDAVVDLKIHHGSGKVFESLMDTYRNDYDYYVVMPHFYEGADDAFKLIKRLPSDKLILLDKELDDTKEDCAAVYQDFKNDIISALESGKHLLSKYKKLFLVFPRVTHYPAEIALGFKKFCIQHGFEYQVISDIDQDTPVEKHEAYIVIEEPDLVNLIKNCKCKRLQAGKDVGIISYNDTPLKEILLDGITVISTDHSEMGKTAALLIMGNQREKIQNPFKLIIRESL
ncbi:GntR family transcriptional regulator [Mucilaginibacter conchicola]|uniref:GntR family transcriptional regulator n=1 Tax=Mucilaginibacter conchicola TaxID=2303333 RepID=A0A372NWJ5_9SPHI|nr:GntR family transcriptional regulator [Mucilaginibacter conchicola]RFZ94486.1 GntR family transcriptional regulator [Mucilaginibacter conchicola]